MDHKVQLYIALIALLLVSGCAKHHVKGPVDYPVRYLKPGTSLREPEPSEPRLSTCIIVDHAGVPDPAVSKWRDELESQLTKSVRNYLSKERALDCVLDERARLSDSSILLKFEFPRFRESLSYQYADEATSQFPDPPHWLHRVAITGRLIVTRPGTTPAATFEAEVSEEVLNYDRRVNPRETPVGDPAILAETARTALVAGLLNKFLTHMAEQGT